MAIAHDEQQQEKLESSKIRINAKGGGRKPILTPKEEIGLCLFYLRQMPTFEILGIQFGISKTEANDTFQKWLRIFRKILPASLDNLASIHLFIVVFDSCDRPPQICDRGC